MEKLVRNEWYEWAQYTALKLKLTNCLLCAPSPLTELVVVPNPYDYRDCADFNKNFCHLNRSEKPYCPAECLSYLGNSYYQRYYNQTGWGKWCQELDIRVEAQKLEAPYRYRIDYQQPYECFNSTEGQNEMGKFKGKCEITWHLNRDTEGNADTPERDTYQAAGSWMGK